MFVPSVNFVGASHESVSALATPPSESRIIATTPTAILVALLIVSLPADSVVFLPAITANVFFAEWGIPCVESNRA